MTSTSHPLTRNLTFQGPKLFLRGPFCVAWQHGQSLIFSPGPCCSLHCRAAEDLSAVQLHQSRRRTFHGPIEPDSQPEAGEGMRKAMTPRKDRPPFDVLYSGIPKRSVIPYLSHQQNDLGGNAYRNRPMNKKHENGFCATRNRGLMEKPKSQVLPARGLKPNITNYGCIFLLRVPPVLV